MPRVGRKGRSAKELSAVLGSRIINPELSGSIIGLLTPLVRGEQDLHSDQVDHNRFLGGREMWITSQRTLVWYSISSLLSLLVPSGNSEELILTIVHCYSPDIFTPFFIKSRSLRSPSSFHVLSVFRLFSSCLSNIMVLVKGLSSLILSTHSHS